MPMKSKRPESGRLIIDTFPFIMHALMHDIDLSKLDGKLTKSQLRTLYMLYVQGPMNMSNLSYHVNLEKGSFTSVIDSLEGSGLVERNSDPKDRRVINVTLTPLGEEFTEEGRRLLLDHINEKLEVLTDSERRNFHQAISTIHSAAEKIIKEKK